MTERSEEYYNNLAKGLVALQAMAGDKSAPLTAQDIKNLSIDKSYDKTVEVNNEDRSFSANTLETSLYGKKQTLGYFSSANIVESPEPIEYIETSGQSLAASLKPVEDIEATMTMQAQSFNEDNVKLAMDEKPTEVSPPVVKYTRPTIKISADRFRKQWGSVFNKYTLDITPSSEYKDMSLLKVVEFNQDMTIAVDEGCNNRVLRENMTNMIDTLIGAAMSSGAKTTYKFTDIATDDNKFVLSNNYNVYTTKDGHQFAVYIKELFANHKVIKLSKKQIQKHIKGMKAGRDINQDITNDFLYNKLSFKTEKVLTHLYFNIAILVDGDKND